MQVVGLNSHTTMRVSVLFPKFVLQVWKHWGIEASSIFVRYFVNSKRYVFISENEDGSVTEIEFRNAIFFLEKISLAEEALCILKLSVRKTNKKAILS